MDLRVDDVLLPTLKALRDGKRTHSSEIRERVAADLNLTDSKRRERTSGAPCRYTRFKYLVAWALVHLGKGETGAGLLERVAPSVYSLTVAGAELLSTPVRQLTLRTLQGARRRLQERGVAQREQP